MSRPVKAFVVVAAMMATFAHSGSAQRGDRREGGGGRDDGRHDYRGGARTNVNVNVDDRRGGYDRGGYGRRDGAAVGGALFAGMAIGAAVRSLPPNCSAVNVNGLTYQRCGNTWYQPQFAGSTPNYIVVAPVQ